jgi:hypothetical protein
VRIRCEPQRSQDGGFGFARLGQYQTDTPGHMTTPTASCRGRSYRLHVLLKGVQKGWLAKTTSFGALHGPPPSGAAPAHSKGAAFGGSVPPWRGSRCGCVETQDPCTTLPARGAHSRGSLKCLVRYHVDIHDPCYLKRVSALLTGMQPNPRDWERVTGLCDEAWSCVPLLMIRNTRISL